MTAHRIDAKWLSIDQAKEHLGCSRRQVYVLLDSDPSFPRHRFGSRWRFDRAELDEWLRSRCSSPAAGSEAAA
jgi:excisionase family DNA binding protein